MSGVWTDESVNYSSALDYLWAYAAGGDSYFSIAGLGANGPYHGAGTHTARTLT